MPDYTFDTPQPVDLRIRVASGSITVTAADTATSTVEVTAIDDEARELADDTLVQMDGSGRRLTIEMPERRHLLGLKRRRVAITVTVPTGSSLTTKTASATVNAGGRYATVGINTASGEIVVDQVDGDVDANCASGDVTIGSGRAIRAHSASGRITIGRATGDVDVRCASAQIRIGVAEASVRAKAASGDITVDEAQAGTISLDVASGDLRIGVRSGVTAHLDLRSISGRIRSELPVDDVAPADGAPLEIRARTTSGNVLVVPASARASA